MRASAPKHFNWTLLRSRITRTLGYFNILHEYVYQDTSSNLSNHFSGFVVLFGFSTYVSMTCQNKLYVSVNKEMFKWSTLNATANVEVVFK